MPILYTAYNAGIESAVTTLTAGQSYATGAKVALQLGIPSAGQIQLVGYGISFDEDATANAANNAAAIGIRSTATATTCTTAHSTSTVFKSDPNGSASRLTMSTATTAFGVTGITSATTLRAWDRRYVPQTGSIDIMIPSDRQPIFGATGAAESLQFLINTTATVNALCYFMWYELI